MRDFGPVSHPPRLPGHRIHDVDYSEGWLRCTCGWRTTATDRQAIGQGNAAIEAAWILHRREVGLATSSVAAALGFEPRAAAKMADALTRVQ